MFDRVDRTPKPGPFWLVAAAANACHTIIAKRCDDRTRFASNMHHRRREVDADGVGGLTYLTQAQHDTHLSPSDQAAADGITDLSQLNE